MPKRRRKLRKLTTVESLQVANCYVPVKRLRGHMLGRVEMDKLSAGLSNSVSFRWELTANVRVRSPHPNQFQIVVNKMPRLSDKKGKKVYSPIYNSALSAENNIYYFRRSLESKTA